MAGREDLAPKGSDVTSRDVSLKEINSLFNTTSGHDHDGTDSAKISWNNLLDKPSETYEPILTKGNLTEATSSILTISGGTGSVIGSGTTIQVKQASSSVSGYLSSTDWSTFNGKSDAHSHPYLSNSTTSVQNGYFGDIYLKDDASPSHYLQITNNANLTANRLLAIAVGDSDRYITLSANVTLAHDTHALNADNQTITSGNGMNFTSGSGNITVTLGTPSSITSSSTNSVTTTSHTHAITGFSLDGHTHSYAPNAFSTIAVSGQSNIVADSTSDTLTFVAGNNISLTTDAGTDSLTINSANYYPTTFTWSNGTTAGPTGSLTGTGMSAVSYGAIPSASDTVSGIITTGTQTIAGSKTFTSNIVGSITGNAGTATKLATARNIGLTGDASGSGSFDGTTDLSITVTVADDSHNHIISNVDGLQTALDAKANLSAPTFTGTVTGTFSGALTGNVTGNVSGSSGSCTGNSATATKLANARTLSLTGDVTGSGSFDGTGDLSITATVADDSHKHTELVPFVSGTQTSSTNAFTGNASTISALYDGLSIRYWLPYAGTSSTATLNLKLSDSSTTGDKTVYFRGISGLTTHYAAGSVISLTYRENVSISGSGSYTGWWCDADYYNGDTYDRTYWANTITAGAAIYSYKLLMQGNNGKFYPLTLETGTGTTKTVSAQEFTINTPILYYATTTTVSANNTFSNVYSEVPTGYLNYTANQASWTSQLPIYLKGTILANGNFKLDNTSYTSFMTQTLPTTEDGFVYILLGYMYSTTAMRLMQYHPIYEYKDGYLREYVPSHKHGNITSVGAIGSTSGLIVKTGTNGILETLTAGTSGQYLQYDGTWSTPPDTDTIYTHPTSGVSAGTYTSVTVDTNGHVTTGTNPTTLSGYGITDAANLNSPALTGIPTAPTASPETNNNQIATTAFVKTSVSNVEYLMMEGDPT